jgi:hypothetical protein
MMLGCLLVPMPSGVILCLLLDQRARDATTTPEESEHEENGAEKFHSVCSGLTTQAQRPGPREAWIATVMRWPGSLQRMVRPRFWVGAHTVSSLTLEERVPSSSGRKLPAQESLLAPAAG